MTPDPSQSFGEERKRIVRALAKEGLGWENIVVQMRRRDDWQSEWEHLVRVIVLGQSAIERKMG